jgi:hypothetical protein
MIMASQSAHTLSILSVVSVVIAISSVALSAVTLIAASRLRHEHQWHHGRRKSQVADPLEPPNPAGMGSSDRAQGGGQRPART